jgi:hypothetical protein
MVADSQVVKLRFARNGCAPMRRANRAAYREMWRNVLSPWAHKQKIAPGTSLSTSESIRRGDVRKKSQAASASACGHATLHTLCARALSLALLIAGVLELDLRT